MESKEKVDLSRSTSTTSKVSQDGDEDPGKRSRINLGCDPDIEFGKQSSLQIVYHFASSNSEVESSEKSLSNFAPLSSLSSAEAVFSIPKILQKILSYCQPKDLRRFRLVSREWRREATNDTLLNWNLSQIRIEGTLRNEQWRDCHYRRFRKPLYEWNKLMNGTGSNTFPSTEFFIDLDTREEEDEEELVTFLSNHGHRIKSLHLELRYYKPCDEIETWCSHCENWCNKFITKLLLEQAPNLEKFEFRFSTLVTYYGIPCTQLIFDNNQSKEDAQEGLNLKLQEVTIRNSISTSVFDLFCRLAPNLKTLFDSDVDHYIEPINRLHLLPYLAYHPYPRNLEWSSIVERIANLDSEVQLNTLFICIADMRECPQFWPRVADICNKLLKKSACFLKNLNLSLMGYLPGLEIPAMSNLNCLTFTGEDFGCFGSSPFFPSGMRFSEKFPKLHTIRLLCYEHDIDDLGRELLSSCGENSVPSVRVINTFGQPIDLNLFQRIFPNARFVDSD